MSAPQENTAWIEAAARKGIVVGQDSFKQIDGSWTIDGMDPGEWIEAMTMD